MNPLVRAWCFTLLLALPAAAQAREVRIVDFWGLFRAARSISGPARVTVRLSGGIAVQDLSAEDLPVLANQRGITSDIHGMQSAANSIVFHKVGEGTWRIVPKSEDLVIDEVIVEEDRP